MTSEDLERARNNDSENKHRRYEMQEKSKFYQNSESVQLVCKTEKQLYVANIMPCIQGMLTCNEQVLLMLVIKWERATPTFTIISRTNVTNY